MKKIIVTICIALLVSLAAIAAKDVFSCYIPIHNRGIAALEKAGDLSVLFIGSSTFRSNLDIDELDANYNDRAYILAYGGNQYVAADIQYDEIKNRGNNKVDLLVLELDPLLLTEEVKLSDSRVIWDLSWDGKKRLWKSMADSGNVDATMFFEYFVTAGMDDLITYPVTEPFYATRYKKGAKTDLTPSSGAEFLESESFDISGIRPVEAQRQALLSLIGKCKADGQKFVLLECPHYYRLQEDPAYRAVLDDMKKMMEEAGADCIYASDVAFDNHAPDYYEDMSHMSSEGRSVYTKALIPLLQ